MIGMSKTTHSKKINAYYIHKDQKKLQYFCTLKWLEDTNIFGMKVYLKISITVYQSV